MSAVMQQLIVVACVCLWYAHAGYIVPPAELQQAPYADWAHHHWVWLPNTKANQTSMLEYAKSYLEHKIPVGAVDLDSEWETGFNNFEFDKSKYPDAKAMVDEFHNMSIRVIFWITSMIDTDSSLYEEGLKKDYYVKDGLKLNQPLKWWHGKGCLLDYTNPAAVKWWHSHMDNVLDVGIDGWKTDGTDPYILEYIDAQGHNGTISYREYADLYYGDFFDYTRQRNGNSSLIMSRPVDGKDPIFLLFSPRRVVFSGWVGDQDPTYEGLTEALKRYMMSAWSGYVGFGSDIGGYRSGDSHNPLGRTKDLFIRWAQLGAFSSLMENGGDNEHRPWMFDEGNSTTIVDIYRQFAWAHMELVSYLLSAGTKAYADGSSIITPLATKNVSIATPDTYAYMLGPNIFVSPINNNETAQKVAFPSGSTWLNYFNHSETHQGGMTETLDFDLTSFPVYLRAGALLPLNVTTAFSGIAGISDLIDDRLTVVLASPSHLQTSTSFDFHRFEADGLTVTATRMNAHDVRVTITALPAEDQRIPIKLILTNVNVQEHQVSVLTSTHKYRECAGIACSADASAGEVGVFLRDPSLNRIVVWPPLASFSAECPPRLGA